MARTIKKILKQAVFEADGLTVAYQAGELFAEDSDLDPTWVTDYVIDDPENEPALIKAPAERAPDPEKAAEPVKAPARAGKTA